MTMRLSPTWTEAAKGMRTEKLLWVSWRTVWELIQSVDHVVAVASKAKLRKQSRSVVSADQGQARGAESSALCLHLTVDQS